MTGGVVGARGSVADRFWRKVDRFPGICWPWQGARHNTKGYGTFFWSRERGKILAHRAAWELANGPIPVGFDVMHECDQPSCCNPSHLMLGTHADNNADRDAKRRQCRGEAHPLSRLSVDDIRAIRTSSLNGNQLAKRYGVERNTIYAILRGKTWKDVA